MECDFATALPYNLDFKTDELDHLPASWQFKDAQELLEGASRLLRLLLSTIMCSGACRAYTPGIHAKKEEDGLLLEFPCNSTRTRSV
jgi:hypothetical protein